MEPGTGIESVQIGVRASVAKHVLGKALLTAATNHCRVIARVSNLYSIPFQQIQLTLSAMGPTYSLQSKKDE